MVMISTALFGRPAAAEGGRVAIWVDPGHVLGRTNLNLGLTLVQNTIAAPHDPAVANAARSLLTNVAKFQNVHIMGWGTLNPEPEPGRFEWSSLDRRMALIRSTGGIPVITLCCAPDWMKGGAPGTTNWSRLPAAPLPEHYADYAELARQVAIRYPDVQYYQVWNELKGFWDSSIHDQSIVHYTELYNAVYEALRSVSPRIKIGGPYASVLLTADPGMGSEIAGTYGYVDRRFIEHVSYWLEHKKGADFITIDGGGQSKQMEGSDPVKVFQQADMFSDVGRWITARTLLPLWWAEWYAAPHNWTPELQNALSAVALIHLALTARVALTWGGEGVANLPFEGDQESLWSDTRLPTGGRPFLLYATMVNFERCFPPGTEIVAARSSSPEVAVFASRRFVMLVNTSNRRLRAAIGSSEVELAPYAVVFQ